MNRIELLGILLMLAIGIVFIIKSRWFERAIDWLLSGTKKPDDKTPSSNP